MKLNDLSVFGHCNRLSVFWYPLCMEKEIKRNQIHSFEFLGRSIIVFKNSESKFFAFDAFCPHMGAHLGQGSIKDDCIQCQFHGWRFNFEGKCTCIPFVVNKSTISKSATLQAWPIKVIGGIIWIWPSLSAPPLTPLEKVFALDSIQIINGGSGDFPTHINFASVNSLDFNHIIFVHGHPIKEVESLATIKKIDADGNQLSFEIKNDYIYDLTRTSNLPIINFIVHSFKKLLPYLGLPVKVESVKIHYFGTTAIWQYHFQGWFLAVCFNCRFREFYKTQLLFQYVFPKSLPLYKKLIISRIVKQMDRALLEETKNDYVLLAKSQLKLKIPQKSDQNLLHCIDFIEKVPYIEFGNFEKTYEPSKK